MRHSRGAATGCSQAWREDNLRLLQERLSALRVAASANVASTRDLTRRRNAISAELRVERLSFLQERLRLLRSRQESWKSQRPELASD